MHIVLNIFGLFSCCMYSTSLYDRRNVINTTIENWNWFLLAYTVLYVYFHLSLLFSFIPFITHAQTFSIPMKYVFAFVKTSNLPLIHGHLRFFFLFSPLPLSCSHANHTYLTWPIRFNFHQLWCTHRHNVWGRLHTNNTHLS